MEREVNVEIGRDCVLFENYFGRLSVLWYIMVNKYKWGEDTYDVVILPCIKSGGQRFLQKERPGPLREKLQKYYRSLKARIVALDE